jgi:RNA polymerase sigma-70 factor (ECF subfamily)
MFEGQRVVTGRVLVNEAIGLASASEDRLELAVREHARLVYRVAYSVLRNHHDAEDAAQETFVRVLRYRRKLADVRDPRTWLARIAWRVAVERRKKMLEIALDDDESVLQIRSRSVGADEALIGAEMNEVLHKLIAALPAKLRDPLTLSTLDEMSTADIAEVLGVRQSAVRSRIFRARQILREKLDARLEGKPGA